MNATNAPACWSCGGTVEGMQWLGAFHAIGARILRRHAELAGLKSNFTIRLPSARIQSALETPYLSILLQSKYAPHHGLLISST